MDTAELNHLQEQITQLARNRFPGPAVQGVSVLQYGDEPEIEPGQLLVQVVIEPPEGQRPDGTEADALIVSEFDHSQKEAIQGFRHDLRSVPQVAMVEFALPGDGYPGRESRATDENKPGRAGPPAAAGRPAGAHHGPARTR